MCRAPKPTSVHGDAEAGPSAPNPLEPADPGPGASKLRAPPVELTANVIMAGWLRLENSRTLASSLDTNRRRQTRGVTRQPRPRGAASGGHETRGWAPGAHGVEVVERKHPDRGLRLDRVRGEVRHEEGVFQRQVPGVDRRLVFEYVDADGSHVSRV
jgi:hypothetical protein